jgi:hypothetical protein
MDGLDLDIQHYSIQDLEIFFKLNKKKTYTAADIELKEYKIREQLLSSGHINERFKRDLIVFLEQAKTWLIEVKCPQIPPPTTIPKNYKWDPLDVPLVKEEIPGSRNEEVIVKPETQFVFTNPSEYFPGVLNPLKTRIITKCLNIDTRFRDNYYQTQSSDFMIQLPVKFNKVVSMQLASLEFPVTFYGISEAFGNHFLYMAVTYELTNTMINKKKIITIPDGNYSGCDLIEMINTLLASNEDPHQKCNVFSDIQFIMDVNQSGSGTGKVYLTTTNPAIKNIILDFRKDINGNPDNVQIHTKIGWNLGFTKPYYHGETAYVGESVLDPNTLRYIYLAIDDFNNNTNHHFVSVFNKSIMREDILARISLKGAPFSLILENDFTILSEPRQYFGPVDIQRLRIRLYDDLGRILPMNHSNFSFCLNLKLVYDI